MEGKAARESKEVLDEEEKEFEELQSDKGVTAEDKKKIKKVLKVAFKEGEI